MRKTTKIQRTQKVQSYMADDAGTSGCDWDLEPVIRHYAARQLRGFIPSRDLDDVINQAVDTCIARLDQKPEDCSLGMFVKGISRNCKKSYLRQHQVMASEMDLDELPADVSDALQLLVQQELRIEIQEKIAKLSETERDELRQHYAKERTFKEIAERSGDKLSTVAARHYRTLKKLGGE